jgi:hypothetical protein
MPTRCVRSNATSQRGEPFVHGRANPESAEHYELAYTYNPPRRGADLTLAAQQS